MKDRIAQAAHFRLPDVMNAREVLQLPQIREVADALFRLQLGLQLVRRVKMLLDGPLRARDDDQDVRDARRGGFFDDVLDHGLVHEREHLFRHRLGDGEEAGAVTSGGNDSFADDGHGADKFEFGRRRQTWSGPRL